MSDNLGQGGRGAGSGPLVTGEGEGEGELEREAGRKGEYGLLGNEKARRPKPTGHDGEWGG